jgi:phosphate transport system substrate-binding protein
MIRQIYNFFLIAFLVFFAALQSSFAFDWGFNSKQEKRTYLYIVGSSTISPFMATISSEFSREQNLKNHSTEMPVVESTGTREGFKFFCEGVGEKYPDFVNASRPIEASELEECNKNGVKEIVAIKLGYDGIVIGNLIGSQKIKLTKEQIFLALAEKVYDNKTKKLVKNPYQTWNQIDAKLPATEIIFYGPPLTSGTRDVFVDLVMEEVCFGKKEFVDAYKDYQSRKKQCATMRADGRFIESGENDNLIISALKNNPKAFGVFGFNFLVANQTTIQPAKIDNISPSFNSIASKQYKLSRPLFVYFKKEHLNLMPEMREFVVEIVSTEVIGKKGYLLHSGLVALTDSELKQVRKNILSQL